LVRYLVTRQARVHQGEAANDIPNSTSVERTIDNSAVLVSLRGKPRKVTIVGKNNSPLRRREFQMLLVVRSEPPRIDGRRDIDLAPPQTMSHGVRRMLIEVEAEQQLGSCGFWAAALQLASRARRAERAHKGFVFLHLAKYFFAMFEPERQRGTDLTQRQVRQTLGDLFRGAAVNFGLSVNILHSHPRPCRKGPWLAISIWTNLNVSCNKAVHIRITRHCC
jgi:hypothetical protein